MRDDNRYGVLIQFSEETEFMYSEGRARTDVYDTSSLPYSLYFLSLIPNDVSRFSYTSA